MLFDTDNILDIYRSRIQKEILVKMKKIINKPLNATLSLHLAAFFIAFALELVFFSDEVRIHLRLSFNGRELLFTEPYTLDEKCHIFCKSAHGVQTFEIAFCLLCVIAVELVPISCGNYRHITDSEILIEDVEGCGKASASCCDDGCANLH